jgi:hypothetical protein
MMDSLSELPVLETLQGYLADLICDAQHPAEIDTLSQALVSVHRALARGKQMQSRRLAGPESADRRWQEVEFVTIKRKTARRE